jgi:hypothetical protein
MKKLLNHGERILGRVLQDVVNPLTRGFSQSGQQIRSYNESD